MTKGKQLETKEILKLAIEKAVKNGYEYTWSNFLHDYAYNYPCYQHDFAKAFWGEALTCKWCGKVTDEGVSLACHDEFEDGTLVFNWEYHLQQIVLEEDPIKYLEQFLEPMEK